MSNAVLMTVLGGRFANQAVAFASLCEEAAKLGVEMLPNQVDVVREARQIRLAHYFRPAIVARIEEALGEDDTALVLFPSRLTAFPAFPPDDSALRMLGRFAGVMEESF